MWMTSSLHSENYSQKHKKHPKIWIEDWTGAPQQIFHARPRSIIGQGFDSQRPAHQVIYIHSTDWSSLEILLECWKKEKRKKKEGNSISSPFDVTLEGLMARFTWRNIIGCIVCWINYCGIMWVVITKLLGIFHRDKLSFNTCKTKTPRLGQAEQNRLGMHHSQHQK